MREKSIKILEHLDLNYRELVENLTDVIYALDAKGKVISVNQASKSVFLFEPEELIGKEVIRLLPHKELEKIKHIYKQLLQGMNIHSEIYIVRKDRERCNIEFTLIPVFKDSELIRIEGIARDITDRKKAEKVIERHNKELSAFNRIAQLVSQSMSINLNEILQSALDGVLDIMELSVGTIYLIDEQNKAFSLAVHRGLSEEMVNFVQKGLPLYSKETFSQKIVKQQKVLATNNLLKHVELPYRSIIAQSGMIFTVGIPLKSKGKTLGVITMSDHEPRDLSSMDTQLLETIGGQIGVYIDNAKLFEKLLVQSEAMESYAALITKAQEEERKRIACDLHDEMAQSLSALSLAIQSVAREITPNNKTLSDKAAKNLTRLTSELDTIIDSVRNFIHDLRPEILDQMGLVPALELLLDELTIKAGIQYRIKTIGTEQRMSGETELTLFRVIQEAVRNTIKHSGASMIAVSIEFSEKTIILYISDNGNGFKVPNMLSSFAIKGKLGLLGMSERVRLLGGTLSIKSWKDKGTIIKVEVPKTTPVPIK